MSSSILQLWITGSDTQQHFSPRVPTCPPTEFFQGYCFSGTDYIFGHEGAQRFTEATGEGLGAELIHLDGPWDGRDDVEAATVEWVHCFNTERLNSMLDHQTPAEVEAAHYVQTQTATAA